MSESEVAIKVDVDTWVGFREGVPRLASMLTDRGIAASFYLSLGPDNSGRAIWRVFTRPGFLAKMIRTRAPGAYGLRTLFMGTLLPAPIIGRGGEATMRLLAESGHEVGLHAWDHVAWHDGLWKMTPDRVKQEVDRGVSAFVDLVGTPPLGFAAPAWRITAHAAEALGEHGVAYMSATRGTSPYWPRFDGRKIDLLELPTTLPTADEVLGTGGINPANMADFFLEKVSRPGRHVFTIHAEMEGRGLAASFETFLDGCQARGIKFVRLIDRARELLTAPEDIPVHDVIRAELPGRPGRVSLQGS